LTPNGTSFQPNDGPPNNLDVHGKISETVDPLSSGSNESSDETIDDHETFDFKDFEYDDEINQIFQE
jgi:hypothetical protein